jgi:hypothetical protein
MHATQQLMMTFLSRHPVFVCVCVLLLKGGLTRCLPVLSLLLLLPQLVHSASLLDPVAMLTCYPQVS